MKESVWKRAASLLLCAALLIVAVPVSQVSASGIIDRQMSGWTFPLAEEWFDDITDLAGCQGTGANALYGQANTSCTDPDHATLANGSAEMTVNVSSTQSVYAPAAGTIYYAAQSEDDWSNAAVIEVTADNGYSYYLFLAPVTQDGTLASGSYVSAGQVIGTTAGTFRFAAVMDISGVGSQFASAVNQVLSSYTWLTESVGSGLVCVNPSATTATSYSSSLVQTFGGPISYTFPTVASAAPAEEAHTCVYDQQNTDAAYLASAATCQSPALYYYSCTCGAAGMETFTYGETADHTWDAGTVTTAATHTSKGIITYTCTVCYTTKTEEVAASTDHVYDQMNTDTAYLASAATCQSPAMYYYSCTCGAIGAETFTYGEATDHTWDSGTTAVQATHTDPGSIMYTCTTCGTQTSQEIAATGHTYDQTNTDAAYLASAATCQSPAMYYYSCTCGAIGTETFTYGEATDHTWDGGTVTAQATHTDPGSITYTCTVCGTTKTEEVAASTDHVYDQMNTDTAYLASAATCESPAVYYYSCICGQVGTATFTSGEATGHTWDGGVVTTEATTTTTGVMTYTCTVCGATKTEEISTVHAHTFSEAWSYDENNHWHAATCEHTDQTSEYGAHTWDEGEITTAATHTSEGVKTYTCTVCGATKTEAIAAITDHTFDQEVVDDKYLASAATCTEPAKYYYSCICGEKGSETFTYGEAAGHTFSAEWSSDETNHWHAATCEHTTEQGDLSPHRFDDGVITKDAGHNVDGEKTYTCLDCGYQKTEVIAGQAHEYNQQIVDDKYLVSAATCESPAVYYYSCVCGEAGTETFTYGEALGHSYSDAWSSNELQHWHAATCEHTDLKSDAADHTWSDGEVTTQPTSTTKGVMTYTCTVCGATKTEEIEPTTHTHTFGTTWQSNSTYHWHAATCEHTNVVSGLAEHTWNSGVITQWATHTTTGTKTYTCTVCGATKTETISQTHTYTLQIASSTYLKSEATCTSAAVYYYSCSCGAAGSETFTYGSALGHTASSTWGQDENYHWTVCTRCGVKGDLIAHTYNSSGVCSVCGYSKSDSHVHTSHLTRVAAKSATCTTDGNTSYYVCSCGKWFSDSSCTSEITDQSSVVIAATGHTDADSNGRCDVCKVRLDTTTDYEVTEGGNTTWLTTSEQGMVFRSSADYSKFDSLKVDDTAVASSYYTVSEGSTVIELSASYLKRLSLGYHTLSIVSSDGTATTGFTVKQGSTSASSNGVWGIVLIFTVLIAIAIPVTYGIIYYRKRMGLSD